MNADLSLYFVTDSGLCGDRGVVETVRLAVDGGARIVQLRDKTATDAEAVAQLVELSQAIAGRALLVVNDRVDVVLAARAAGARVDGVHLGQSDDSVVWARAQLGPDAIVGLSANRPEHLEAVRQLPEGTVDYLGVGVVRPTNTKPDHPPVLGVDGFRAFAAASPLPCVAIGGVGVGDVAALRAAGAVGVAVVSALCTATDPAATARDFVSRWRAAGVPRVLSIAGSDPSGGAGIQADLKSIAANGGYGMAALTALTAQNTKRVVDVHTPPAEFLRTQLDTISDDIVVDAVKIGMLANADIAVAVAEWLDRNRPPIVVIDPVMVATSGDRLLDAEAEQALRGLLSRADVITPNLSELEVLAGRSLNDWDDALAAAGQLSAEIGAQVLVKGGHLPGREAADALVDAAHGVTHQFPGARIDTVNTHGTGCSLSSAIATLLARGDEPEQAVSGARAWLRESIRESESLRVGSGHGPVSHFAGLWSRGGLETRPTETELARDWWDRIARIRGDIDALPFIRALADGTLDRGDFVFYLEQDALYLGEYSRVLAEASRLAPTAAEQAFWAEASRGAIVVEMELHASWLTPAQGVSEETFSAAPAGATIAYLDHLRAVAFRGDYAELIAAILPCFWLYADLGRRLHAGDFGEYARAAEHPYASWLATYADPAFDAATEQAIAYVSAAASKAEPAQRETMFRAFEIASEHELAFFAAPSERDS